MQHTLGWPDDDAQMFRECIRALDGVYLRHANRTGDEPEIEGSDNPARDAVRGVLRGGKR